MEAAAVIPAYNEEDRIGEVIEETEGHVDRILVVDDGSTDCTAGASEEAGADVLIHDENRGYLGADSMFRSEDSRISFGRGSQPRFLVSPSTFTV
ncbi:hypothetical protein AKJ57_01250 [candidate division MSBL1 archaeon SCGC-AAA259A05]|uniref:Glycosyltransferase 2-like domain-containing protein n=1 Tax=candidate division MSBL1 archaeon SCGC-AAA259A05 TaxID=1698259 RepID=A0A133UB75_9EURY|nr:hypothetical protein AKJ57_01250 [candidate division MSBL1 archaeon SCGC-AAA259A05]